MSYRWGAHHPQDSFLPSAPKISSFRVPLSGLWPPPTGICSGLLPGTPHAADFQHECRWGVPAVLISQSFGPAPRTIQDAVVVNDEVKLAIRFFSASYR